MKFAQAVCVGGLGVASCSAQVPPVSCSCEATADSIPLHAVLIRSIALFAVGI